MDDFTFEEKVSLAFGRFPKSFSDAFFPEGVSQAGIIVSSVCTLFELDADALDDDDYFNILSIFMDFLKLKVMLEMENESVLKIFTSKHDWLIKTTKDAVRIFTFFHLHANDLSFSVATDSDVSSVNMFSLILFPNHQYTEDNKAAHTENLDDEEFGLVPGKPVYTVGIPGSNAYLSSLVTENDEPITWERLGSTCAEGINGMIDVYITYLPNGEEYKKIYVNMYGVDFSRKAPRGFKFK